MICPRNDCKLNFDKPLELFNGRWHCPHCKNNIFPDENTVLEITAENHIKLVNSDKIFYRYWLLDEGKEKKNKALYLKEAMGLCSESAFLNNPYALVNMGYYYENNYIDLHRSIPESLRAAYLYYNAVCFNRTKRVSLPYGENAEDERYLDNKELVKIKKRAALNLYNLLNKIPPNQENIVLGNTVKIHEKQKKLAELLKLLGVEELDSVAKGKSDDTITSDMLLAIMCENQGMSRAPLFGIFRLSKNDILRLEEKTYTTKNGVTKGVSDHVVEGKLKIKVAKALSPTEAREFKNIRNGNELRSIAERESDDTMFYLFFFNKTCESPYFKKSALKQIYQTLTRFDDEQLREFIHKELVNSYIFGADDIYNFLKKKNDYLDAVKRLYDYCIVD